MKKIKISAGIVFCEISGEDFFHMEKEAREFFSAFKEFPGFSMENSSTAVKSRKSSNTATAENSSEKLEICSPDEMLEWLANQDGRNSEWWVAKHSPFANASRTITGLVRAGRLVRAETPYTKSSGHMGYMQALYLEGDELPAPYSEPHDGQDDVLVKWVQENPGYKPRYVENSCGIPVPLAAKALNRCLKSGRVLAEKTAAGTVQVIPAHQPLKATV